MCIFCQHRIVSSIGEISFEKSIFLRERHAFLSTENVSIERFTILGFKKQEVSN